MCVAQAGSPTCTQATASNGGAHPRCRCWQQRGRQPWVLQGTAAGAAATHSTQGGGCLNRCGCVPAPVSRRQVRTRIVVPAAACASVHRHAPRHCRQLTCGLSPGGPARGGVGAGLGWFGSVGCDSTHVHRSRSTQSASSGPTPQRLKGSPAVHKHRKHGAHSCVQSALLDRLVRQHRGTRWRHGCRVRLRLHDHHSGMLVEWL
jgi:hypothetical protein